jgi:hypothetical protein
MSASPWRRAFDSARDPYTARNALGILIDVSGTGGGGAPTDAEYITASPDATLTNERVLTDTATITWDFSTAGQAKANATVGGGGSTRDLLATISVVGLGSVDTASGLFTTAYDVFEFVGELTCPTGGAGERTFMRVSTDNGASYDTSASYIFEGASTNHGGTLAGYAAVNAAWLLNNSYYASNQHAFAVCIRCYRFGSSGGAYKTVFWEGNGADVTGYWYSYFIGGGYVGSTLPITNVRFVNTTAQPFGSNSWLKLYGIK